MSTRKGTIIRLRDLIDEGFVRTKTVLEQKGRELAPSDIQKITVGAIKYAYLSQDREKNIVFTWDKALSLEGNSGPYIQYAYVRANKLLAELSKNHVSNIPQLVNQNLSDYDKRLIKLLVEQDKKIAETIKNHKPHILAKYCYDLAGEFNAFYVHTENIVQENNADIKNIRFWIIAEFCNRLKLTFELLGMEMPGEM